MQLVARARVWLIAVKSRREHATNDAREADIKRVETASIALVNVRRTEVNIMEARRGEAEGRNRSFNAETSNRSLFL